MPSWLSRSVMRKALRAGPGRPPGNSQGDVPGSPMVAWPLACRGGLADQPGQWLGKQDRLAPQLEADLVAAGVEVFEGEADNAAGGLGVEEHEQPGDPVLGVDGVV